MKPARNSALKFIAALLAIFSLTACAVSVLCVGLVANYRGYEKSSDALSVGVFIDALYGDIAEVSDYYSLVMTGEDWAQERIADYEQAFAPENTNFFFTVTDYDTGELLLSNYSDDYLCYVREDSYLVQAGYGDYYDASTDTYYYGYEATTEPAAAEDGERAELLDGGAADDGSAAGAQPRLRHVVITGFVRADTWSCWDRYTELARSADFLYTNRYGFIAAAAGGGILSILLLVFLLYGAGRRKGTGEISLRLVDRIPWDLFSALCAGVYLLGVVLFFTAFEDTLYGAPTMYDLQTWGFFILAAATGLVVFLTSFATRFKVKGWWKNSLIYLLLHWLGGVLHHPMRQLKEIAINLPLIWKTLLLGAAMVLLEVFALFQVYWYGSVTPILLFNIIAALIILSAAVCMKKLQQGCQAIADGDGDFRVDTSRMYLDFRRHGEDLNRIGDGISVAVEERLKSERFKTELITNVSHDLKTPLTSIVNYVDLLSKLELPEEARGYVEVLRRQSARLKKLTEDLVEASKASTGNLSVTIEPVNLSELVGQVTGEYGDRFEKAGLQVVVQLQEEPVTALGDGRYLWRVMDNLLSNVCKYALPGTRVYIDTYEREGSAFITVKNISRDRLNVSAEELMERFVRGDTSRNTEGSGLGLSIAQSLAQLMGGKLTLTVDGDLFKAEIRLPVSQE